MKIILEPLSGTPKANLDRARVEIDRVLNFRGTVTSAKAKGDSIIVELEINSKWDLPMTEKVELLKQWIPAKVKLSFKVLDVYLEDNAKS